MNCIFGNSKSSLAKLSGGFRVLRNERNGIQKKQLRISQSFSNYCYVATIIPNPVERKSNVSDSIIRRVNFGYPNTLLSLKIDHTNLRYISLSAVHWEKEPLKPSSKVEETVQCIKEQQAKLTTAANKETAVAPKRSWRQAVWDELVHYYHGFRLLFIDIKISTGLCLRLLTGKPLTRREHRLLVRTVGDIFRLVPFSVFIIVPFLEFTLPLFLKFFPGMLPSTFQTAKDVETKMRNSLKVKLEMAKFLQQTLDSMTVQNKDRMSQTAKEFTEWFQKVRKTGGTVSNEEILKYLKVFEDEITLDSLDRSQLIALCRVLELQTLGPSSFLRFQLRMKLRSLVADDKIIQREGLDSLSLAEVQQACRARGMRAYGLSEAKLREQLAQWMDLSLNHKVPASLLLLTRALMLPETVPAGDQLKATICTLPENIVTQTKAAIGEKEGKIDNKVKLELLKEEERRMKEERKEMLETLKAKEAETKAKEAAAKEELKDSAPVIETSGNELKDTAPTFSTSKDFEVLEDALEEIAKEKKKLIVEKEEIEDLKEEMADYKEDVNELKEVTRLTATDKSKSEIRESKAAKRLYNQVNNMINKMDRVLNQLEKKESILKKDLEDAATKENVTDELIRIDELMAAIKKIMKVSDNTRLEQIERVLGKIDDDRDGSIKVEDVLKVIELIGKENVQLSPKQLDELVELIDKEELLEVEDKIEKALHKDRELKESQQTQSSSTDVDANLRATTDLESKIPPPPPPVINPKSKDAPKSL